MKRSLLTCPIVGRVFIAQQAKPRIGKPVQLFSIQSSLFLIQLSHRAYPKGPSNGSARVAVGLAILYAARMPPVSPESPAKPAPEMGDALRALIAWRRDVRRFKPDPVDRARLIQLLQTAQLAPSVGNAQPWRFVFVDCPDVRANVRASFAAENERAAANQPDVRQSAYRALKLAGLDQAPVQLAVFCDHEVIDGHGLGRQSMPEMLDYSVVCAVHTFWLLARADGLGVGWISILDPKRVTAALTVPPAWALIAYLCVGHPQEEHLDPELVRADWQQRIDTTSTVFSR